MYEKNELYINNQNLVFKVIRDLNLTKVKKEDFEDLLQEARMGLLVATKAYKPDKGVMFSTFAYTTIRNTLFKYLAKNKKQNIIDTGVDIWSLNLSEITNFNSNSVEKMLLEIKAETNLVEFKTGIDILLLRLQGYNYMEIAKILHYPKPTVYAYVYETKKFIRSNYQKSDFV